MSVKLTFSTNISKNLAQNYFLREHTVNPFNFAASKFYFFILFVQNFTALKICFFLVVPICYDDEQIYS